VHITKALALAQGFQKQVLQQIIGQRSVAHAVAKPAT
jgi:hypothetical protein